MEKLRQVVSEDNPKLLYSKIKKVDRVSCAIFGANLSFSVDLTLWPSFYPFRLFAIGY